MTNLLIDLGNTALKWCLPGEEDNPHTVVHRDTEGYKNKLYEEWLALKLSRVVGCTVAAPEIAFSMTKFFKRPRYQVGVGSSAGEFPLSDFFARKPLRANWTAWC